MLARPDEERGGERRVKGRWKGVEREVEGGAMGGKREVATRSIYKSLLYILPTITGQI